MEFQGPFLKRRWVHSNNIDEPIGFEEYVNTSGVGSGDERVIYADRQGSVIWVTEPATGSVVAAYEYDGYGQITQTQGTLAQPYGYTGREYDAESGLYHYRARAYDPANGVFLQSDPIGFSAGETFLFGYGAQNPHNMIDPDGNNAMEWSAKSGLTTTGAGAAVWGYGMAISKALSRIMNGLKALELLNQVKTTSPAHNVPKGPGDCRDPNSFQIHKKWRNEYKRLESSGKLSCDGLTWSIADTMERSTRAYKGYKAATLRRFDMAMCFRGGDEAHREHADQLERTARECMTK